MSLVDLDPNRTIVAIASPPGKSTRGIVRLSGSGSVQCLNQISDPPISNLLTATAVETSLRIDGISIPVEATVLVWPNHRSYTCQPSAEIHLHGSPPIIEALVGTLMRCGASLARAGEFTLRAFLAGRLDLSQAEAVIGTVEASSDSEFAIALSQSAGGLRDPLENLRHGLLELLAHLEAGLDFVEDDIQFISRNELRSELNNIRHSLQSIRRQIGARKIAEDGWRVALIGRPNVGKSSLFNALLGRPAAITTEIAGTTRDYLIQPLHLHGFKLRLVDTAGLDVENVRASGENPLHPNGAKATRAGDCQIEALAQLRTSDVIAQADLQLFCVERGEPLDSLEEQIIGAAGDQLLIVETKSDLGISARPTIGIPVSSFTGQGMDALRQGIAQRLERLSNRPHAYAATIERCSESLAQADDSLSRALDELDNQAGDEIIAGELRAALEHLGRIVGAVYSDEILGRIFSRFCIGK